MSTEVDSRIVEMKFDSKDFEKNAQSTLSMLDKLKAKLNFSDTKESFNSFDTSKLRKELDKINDFDGGKLEGVFDKLEYRMSNMGIFTARIVENIADDIYNMVKKAMDNIGKVVTFAEQGIVQGGYNRAANIQSAKFQLEGLGIKWSEIYGDIDYAVTNTAYSLDQAAIVASQLASSGIKPGGTWKDLSGKEQDIDYMAMILRSISGTASATGGKADYADIGRIFTKMLSYGKVYTQNLNELATYGIGAKGIVADYLNQINYKGSNKWTEQRVQDVMSDRQGGGLDPQIVIEAFFNKFADHATAANETLTGVTANLRASLARIGEKFFEPIIQNGGPLVKLMDALRISLNDLNKVIGPITESFGKYIGGLIEKFTDKWFFETTTDPETGEQKRTMKLGGIFSSFMEPWKEAEWLPTKIGEGERRQGLNLPKEYLQEYETRAQKIAGNLRDIVQNIVSIVTGVGKIFTSAFKGATDGGFSLASVLVTITNFLNKLTKTIANFVNAPEFVNSGIYLFFRFLADSVRIMISFAKSFKKHIIDPIFSAGKAAASATGVGSWFRDLFDRIHNFSLKLREEGNEDYFGPFLEKIKAGAKAIKEKLSDLFGGIGTTVKNGMRDIIDWWKPIKDIIFDTDLGFKDKMAAIKQYFSENFELPGWSKVKDIFGGIADAVGKAFNALKKFLGFGGKKNEGIPDPDQYELVASKGDFSGIFGISSELEKADKSTEKLTTIGDRISNFFSKVGEAFSSIDLGGIKGVTLALLAIVILLAVGIALAVKKVLDSMKKLVIDFPKLASDILKSFQGVMDEVAAMFKAKKYEIYTQALKNIAIATAILTAVFIGLAGIIAIVDHFGGGNAMADGLKQAGIVIAGIAGSLTVMLAAIIAVTNLTGGGSGYALGISKSGLTASAPSASLAAVAAIIKSFVDGIVALAAVVVVLGALSYIPGLLDSGFDALDKIVLRLSIFILGVISLVGVINLLAAWNHEFKSGKTWIAGNQTAFAKSLASIAGILMSIVVGVLILTPVIAVLGILSKVGLFSLGIDALMHITGWLALTTGALLIIVAVISKVGELDGKRIAGAIFGLAAVITAVTLGVLAFSASMIVVSRLDSTGFAKSIGAFIMISAALIGIPAALMAIYNHMSKVNILRFDNKVLRSMTLMVLAIGASVLAMSIGLRAAASSDPVSLLITVAGIAGIFGTIAAIMYNLAKFDNAGLTKAAVAMGVMGGVIIALNTMLIILSHHLTTNMIIAGAIMIGEVVLLAGAIFGLAKFLNRFGTGLNFTSLVQFAGAMALVAASILPISAALYIVMAAVGGFNMNVGQIIAAMGGMALLVGVLAFAVTHMLTSFGDQRIRPKAVSAMVASILSVSAGVALMGGAIAAILATINATKISETGAVFTILAFAGVIVAFGFAMKMLLESSMKVKDIKKVVLPLAVAVASIVVPIGLIAGAVALLSRLPMGGVIAGGSVLLVISVVTLILSQVVINMSRKLRMSKNLLAKLGITLGAYAALCLAMIPLAGALRMIAKIGTGDLIKAGIALGIMSGAVLALTTVITIIGNKTLNIAGVLATMGSFVGVTVGLYAISVALQKLSTFKFEDIKEQLIAMGVVALVAVGIAALFGLVPNIGAGALAAAGMLLSVAVVMASVGVLLWLSAEALEKFVDVLLKIDGKMGTVTNSMTGLLTGLVSAIGSALKEAIIGLANAISDPDIMNAISDAVTGILTWVRDNIGVWTKLIIEIAANFAKAIVEAINLEELGKWIDEKLLGGAITTSVDVLVKASYDIQLADVIGRADSAFTAKAKEIFTSEKALGYTDAQWDILNTKYSDKINELIHTVIESEVLGNKEMHDWLVNNFENPYKFLAQMLDYYAKEAGLVSPGSMEGKMTSAMEKLNTIKESLTSITNGTNVTVIDLFPNIKLDTSEIELKISSAMEKIRQAQLVGWNTEAGQQLIRDAQSELYELAESVGDPSLRNLIYSLMYELGMTVPEGFKDGAGINESEKQFSYFTNYIEKLKEKLKSGADEEIQQLKDDKQNIQNAYADYYQAGTAALKSFMDSHGGMTPEQYEQWLRMLYNESRISYEGENPTVKAQRESYEQTYGKKTKDSTLPINYGNVEQRNYSGSVSLDPYDYKNAYATGADWSWNPAYIIDQVYTNYDTSNITYGDFRSSEAQQEFVNKLSGWLKSNDILTKYQNATVEQRQQIIKVLEKNGYDLESLTKASNGLISKYTSDILEAGSGLKIGMIGLENTVKQGESSVSNTLTGGDGFNGVSHILPLLKLDKFYFNPLQAGLTLGYDSVGKAGIDQFSDTLETTGEVLGASRPKVESEINSNYISPLMLYLASGGTLTGNSYMDAMLLSLSQTITARPYINIEPIFNAGNQNVQKAYQSYFQAGTAAEKAASNTKSQWDILRDKIIGYVNTALNFKEGMDSPFRVQGEMITAGLMYGMQDSNARRNIQTQTKNVSMSVVNYIKKAFNIHSPAKDQELIWASEMVTAGFSGGLTDQTSQGYINDGTNSLATTTENSLTNSMSGIDMGSISDNLSNNLSSTLDSIDIGKIGGKLKDAITSKLPSWSDITSQFGWEKGISGNIEGLKNVWGMVKDAFSGGLDLEGILSDAGLDISSFANGLDLSQMGFSISADNIIDMNGIKNEFGGFDINDYTTNTDLSVKLDLDTRMADDWMKQNSSIDMAASIPITGGYERSTTGSNTYVSNYSFNQTNTSPQALSARDTARYTDLMLRRAGGWRATR